MISGIGIDIVEKKRILAIYKKFGETFAKKILHQNELKIFYKFDRDEQKIAYLAKRFAAKEAYLKALGTGLREGLSLKTIETLNDTLGKPTIKVKNNQHKIHLSISDEKTNAIAMVVLEV